MSTTETDVRPSDGDDGFDDDLELEHDTRERRVSDRTLGVLLVVLGGVALAAASVLTYDKFKITENPQAALSCDFNPFVSCGGVMTQPQAEVFGFPNSFMGMIGFAVVVTIGMVLLGGSRLAGWVWGGLQVGVVLGMAFIVWLMTQSIFAIGALCPYCMVVWAMMIPIFWYVTRRNLVAVSGGRPGAAARVVVDYHVLLVFVSYVVVIGTILAVFGDKLWA
ncbi:vitamin K epoxide reductase family protein [Solicola sp. PLA-1-18]|uniref:vitamin K epoxide reductase family protein n=1 Tax=Solicola sp. PLA-1-18 TaxID=3380532 RepID=UPI003B80F05E